MKILQLNTVLATGSTGSICRGIYDELTNYGHDCLIVYGRGPEVEGYNSRRIGNSTGIYSHAIMSKVFDRHGLHSKSATKQLIKIVDEYQPDIIQMHNIHGYYLNYPILFDEINKRKIPVVWLMHDQWAISGGPAYLDGENLEATVAKRTQKMRKSYPDLIGFDRYTKNYQLKQDVFTSLEKLLIVTPSNWLKYEMESTFLKQYEIVTIHNGINLEKFSPKPLNDSEQIKLLGIASVWDERKGLNFFERLAGDLDTTYEITLVGVSNQQKEGLPKHIKTIEKISSQEKLSEIYSDADVLVNPTMQDNFPTIILEAQACGTPVITFDTGGCKESLIDSTGEVVEKGNYEMLLNAIKLVSHKNKTTVDACVSNAENFDNKIVYKKYIDLYTKIMEETNGFKKDSII